MSADESEMCNKNYMTKQYQAQCFFSVTYENETLKVFLYSLYLWVIILSVSFQRVDRKPRIAGMLQCSVLFVKIIINFKTLPELDCCCHVISFLSCQSLSVDGPFKFNLHRYCSILFKYVLRISSPNMFKLLNGNG